jgi:hypothetical protein
MPDRRFLWNLADDVECSDFPGSQSRCNSLAGGGVRWDASSLDKTSGSDTGKRRGLHKPPLILFPDYAPCSANIGVIESRRSGSFTRG